MIELSLVGIGTGSPDHLTLGAIAALQSAELILLPRKGEEKAALADIRRRIVERHLSAMTRIAEFDLPQRRAEGDYLGAVHDWHDEIARAWMAQIGACLPGGGRVALMVWGDPSLYDSSLRIAGRLGPAGMAVTVRVVPGITSLQALTAAHAIPLNELGAPVWLTTGRALRAQGWPAGADSVAVMLDQGGAFEALEPAGIHIWWGGCLGLPEQVLIKGPLADVAPAILARRADLRVRVGWVMDIYLMRRSPVAELPATVS
ncbi:MAG: precorrin-6A synthase (deacetylating) [Pararhodobacter sp.]